MDINPDKRQQQFLIESWACSLTEIYGVARPPSIESQQASVNHQDVIARNLCEALNDHYEFLLADEDDKTDGSKDGSVSQQTARIQKKLAQEILDLAGKKWLDRQNTSRNGADVAVTADAPSPNTTSSNTGSSSFSWFDQLQFSTPRVMIEDIESATTLQDQLKLLRKVEYVEDVCMDWNVILPILQRGLQQQLQEQDQGDDVTQNQILELIRTWYRQCRSSPDMVTLQYDLCTTVMETILRSPTHNYPSLLQLWHDMWIDIMTLFYDTFQPNLERMEWIALLWLRLEAVDEPDASSLLSALASLDPTAKWCSCWMMQYTTCPSRLLTLLRQSDILPFLFGHLDPNRPASTNTDTVRIHCFAIVCSALRTTRAALFPWDLLNVHSNVSKQMSCADVFAEVEKKIEQHSHHSNHVQSLELKIRSRNSGAAILFDLLWNEITRKWKGEASDAKTYDGDAIKIFIEGLEVILWGCWILRRDDTNLFRSLVSKIEQDFNGDTDKSTSECSLKQVHVEHLGGQLLNVLVDLRETDDASEDMQRLLCRTISKMASFMGKSNDIDRAEASASG